MTNKEYKLKFEISGVDDLLERKNAQILLKGIYDAATDYMNEIGIDTFNSNWESMHEGESDIFNNENYILSYNKFFKDVCDEISNLIRIEMNSDYTYKLDGSNPLSIDNDNSIIIIKGYKELLN